MSNLMRTFFAGSFVLIGLSTLAHAAGPDASRGQGAVPARPGLGPAVRAGVPLSAGRLDRPPHRGRALRAGLPARPADGPGDRRLRRGPGRRSQPQGARRRLARRPDAGQRPVPPPLRRGIPRGNERDRRRRRGRRGEASRAGRSTSSTSSRSTPRSRSTSSTAPSRPPPPASKAGRSASPPTAGPSAAPGRALQRLRRHRPGHGRRPDRLRPHHDVEPATTACHFNVWLDVKPAQGHRVLMQTYPGGIQSGMDYYHERRRPARRRDHHRPDQVRPRRPGPRLADPQGPPVRRLDRRAPSRSSRRRTTACTPTNGSSPTPRPTRSPCSSWARTRASSGGAARTSGSAAPRGSTGAATTPRTSTSGSRRSPALEGKPANLVFRPSDRDRTWLQLFDEQARGRSTPTSASRRSRRRRWPAVALARRQVHHLGDGQGAEDLGPVRPAAGPDLGADRRRSGSSSPASGRWSPTTGPSSPPSPRRRPRRRQGRRRPRRHRPQDHADDRPTSDHPPAWHGTILPRPTPTPGSPPRSPTTRRSSRWRRRSGRGQGWQARGRRQDRLDLALFAPDQPLPGGRRPPWRQGRPALRDPRRPALATMVRDRRGQGRARSWPRSARRWATTPSSTDGRLRPGPRRPRASRPPSSRGRREGPRQAARPIKAAWLNGDALAKLGDRRPGSPGIGPVLGGRLLRGPARRGPDRLRDPRRGRRPARGRRHAPAQARRPLVQRHASRSRPTPTSPTTT